MATTPETCEGTIMDCWSTADLPRRDQFSFWKEVLCQNYVALDTVPADTPARQRSFFGEVSAHTLSTINVTTIQSTKQLVLRGRREISRMPSEVYFLNLQVSGECRMKQFGREAHLRPGEFALVDSTEPYENDYCSERWKQYSFRIPRHLLLPLVRDPRAAVATRVSGAEGIGALAVSWLTSVNRNVQEIQSDEAQVGRQLVEVVAMSLGLQAGSVDTGTGTRAKKALHEAVVEYINLNLADPDLSPPKVAAHFGVSPRYLHRALEESGSSFSQIVLAKRLERCATDLTQRRERPIGEIAMRWGFNDFSHFSRTFKLKFGIPPRDYRAASLSFGHDEQFGGLA